MAFDVHVSSQGPMFTALGPKIVSEYLDDAVEQVAQAGKNEVDRVLGVVIRNPTPYYQTRINIRREGIDRIINDAGVIYGPWLEGVGSKNKTTRFKGYFTFRRTRQWLNVQAKIIANDVLGPYVDRLGG